jgi:hypothetical protein
MKHRAALQVFRQPAAVVVDDVHVEAAGALRGDLSDPPHADDAEGLAGDLGAHHEGRAPGVPRAGADQVLALAGASGRPEQAEQGDLRGGVGQHVRGVGDDHAAAAGGGEVDMVDPHREVGDDLHRRRKLGHQRGVDVFSMADQQGVGAGSQFQQTGPVVKSVVRIEDRGIVPGQPRLDGLGQLAGNDDDGLVTHGGCSLRLAWAAAGQSTGARGH